MKRTALKRGSVLKRKTPLRAASPAKRKPVQRATKSVQRGCKEGRFRSPAYLAFVRTLPCCVCGSPANAAHHLIGLWNVSGMGLKAPDSMCMPVCDGPGDTCHRRIHSEAYLKWQQPIFLIETISAGLDEFRDGPIHDALIEARDFVTEKTV